MRIVDMIGKDCPAPVIEAKKELDKPESNGVVVLVDNTIAVTNLEKLANSMGCRFSCSELQSNVFEVMIESRDIEGVLEIQKQANVNKNLGDWVVVISRDTMGEGAQELGQILIKGFIYALTELDDLPSHVIFLNSGAKLTANASNTLSDLKTLEQKGAKVLTCGTCSKYYELQDDLGVGEIANMFEIASVMANASKVVNI